MSRSFFVCMMIGLISWVLLGVYVEKEQNRWADNIYQLEQNMEGFYN